MIGNKGCPLQDPFYDLKVLNFICSVCVSEYTILSDELENRHHKCGLCGNRIVDTALTRDGRINELTAFARSLGASEAKLIAAERVIVEDRFRRQCEEPRCPNYDTSINCPPHSISPAEFREQIKSYIHVMAFKFDAPTWGVHGAERREVGRLLHETTAAIERQAKSLGFERACGYSSGGCKKTFCFDDASCAALEPGGRCRFPDEARASLSGMGVNWHELSKALGWTMRGNDGVRRISKAETVMLAGLIFLE